MATPTILVADDDAWILRMVTTVLEKRGYVVSIANDGQDALDKAVEVQPDLIITDVMMPRMDGWQLVKALRARTEFTFVPVIFLTALSSDDDRIRGFRLGADDYLPKPFRFEELDLRVANTLRRRQLLEQAARDHLNAATAAPQAEPHQSRPDSSRSGMALLGTLDQVGLPALLTLLELERKTGVLTLTNKAGDQSGKVYVRAGRVISAHFAEEQTSQHEECVYALLNWTSGRFSFGAETLDHMDDRVQQTTTHLLMEGARRIDEETC